MTVGINGDLDRRMPQEPAYVGYVLSGLQEIGGVRVAHVVIADSRKLRGLKH